MRKLHLAALSYDRDGILDALERTHAVEVKEYADTEGTAPLKSDAEDLSSYLASLETALGTLLSYAELAAQADKTAAPVKDGFSVSYSEFMAAKEYRPRADLLVERTAALTEEKLSAASEEIRLTRAIAAAKPYAPAKRPFDHYCDGKSVAVRFGYVPSSAWENLKQRLGELPLAAYEETATEDGVLLTALCHKSVADELESVLSANNFSPCPYTGAQTGGGLLAELNAQLSAVQSRMQSIEKELTELSSEVRSLKIYCDYVGFRLEKAKASEKMRTTEHAFFLEAFVPADEEENVRAALDGRELPVFYEFSDPAEDEFVPTLAKNNKVVENFELITNMYSPPSAREFDPNTVMSFFYSLFLGFIMADIGYGLMMLIGGGIIYFKSRKGGLKSLSGVFSFCGIFTIVWGFLFNSLFGIPILPYTVMPDPQTRMYQVMGIGLPAVLVVSLMLGVIQLMAGYLCKAVQSWRRGSIWDGIFDGVVWAVFSLGVEFALLGLVEDFGIPFMTTAGGIIAGVSLLVAVCTAGRKQKFLGKITKGFGSLYGLISYFSDVLSYLRLYALMLTGAIIAQVVSQYAIQMLTSGSFLVAVGAILMVVGHIFNLAIGLLGAYIHTARLQYIEFFGKFYEGDGELFVPLGSEKKHIYLENAA